MFFFLKNILQPINSAHVVRIEKDTHLIGSWLNVSMDLIVGDCQARDHFWMRVIAYYNNFQGELRERAMNKLKS